MISILASRFIMVYGGHLTTKILDMEDTSKTCNDAELVPQIPVGYNAGPEYLENIFSRSLITLTHQRKLRQKKCLLFNF